MPDFGRWTANGGDPSLNEINRTDRFIDGLASQQPVYSTDPGEAELAQLLAGWRDEIREAPVRAVVTPRDAVIALDRAAAARRRRRMSTAVIGSVAAAVLCLGGFGAVVAGAGPGDPLYGLRTMLFGEPQQAPRTDAVALASQQLAEVQQLIDQGQWEAAQDKLQTLTTTVATVNDVEQKQELVEQWQDLTVKVETQDANATVPPNVPPPAFPDLPAVVLDTTTSSTTSSETTSPSETTTPSTPLPTPTTPLPSPTPTPTTPLPSPTPTTPLPSPSPTPTTYSPLPTPTTYSPFPTPVPTPLPSVAEQEEEPAPTEPPVLEVPAPETTVTTTIVQPKKPDQPR
jgi:Anti-sigma-D factor RsdA to sigma factor binding region